LSIINIYYKNMTFASSFTYLYKPPSISPLISGNKIFIQPSNKLELVLLYDLNTNDHL